MATSPPSTKNTNDELLLSNATPYRPSLPRLAHLSCHIHLLSHSIPTSPANIVQLTLAFDDKPYVESSISNSPSISSEFVILDPTRIKFLEIDVDKENQKMVSEYFSVGATVPFVHLRGSSESMEDFEMTMNSNESPDGSSVQNFGLFSSSTISSVSDDRIILNIVGSSKGPSPGTPTSKSGKVSIKSSDKEEEDGGSGGGAAAGEDEKLASVFKYPFGNINIEDEQSAMQQQIVDMYMRSMQQFSLWRR